jgi:predicted amidophosphoribosyltransferase
MPMNNVRRIFDKFRLVFLNSESEKVESIYLSEIKPMVLGGAFDEGFALGKYSRWETSSRKRTKLGNLIHQFKYEQNRHSGELLSGLVSEFIDANMDLKSAELILTVPPSFKSRPFGPVSFMAEKVRQRTGIPWESDAFVRTRLTRPQKEMVGKESKQLNVINTFKIAKPIDLKGKRILLLDDVIASGATLDELSSMLKLAGADKIYVLVLAKSICPGMGDSSAR